jgi:hypothetical protein
MYGGGGCSGYNWLLEGKYLDATCNFAILYIEDPLELTWD